MKVLVIMGSLRKKNTYQTVKKIENILSDNCEFEYVFLKDENFKNCIGCHLCISHGEDNCPLKDDRDLIIEKIEESDGVILASPNYVMNVSWIMKNYIDRFAYTLHRPKFFNQNYMILITSGSNVGSKKALKSLSVITSGGEITSKLRVFFTPGMRPKKVELQEKRIEKMAYKFSKSLSNKKEHKPTFSYLIWFSIFKGMSYKNKNEVIADYEYYKDKDYFTEVELNIFQRQVVGFLSNLVRIVS
ncbi:MAG: flavodoxin family protein [Clostridiales bacterium]|nr:flavodoxin family protein [Clostridiales bacterium]